MQTIKNRLTRLRRATHAACSTACCTICCAGVLLLTGCGSAPVGPGFYRVQRGDTLSQIARRNGQSVGAIVRWNNLPNPDVIEVGRVLRVSPPGRSVGAAVAGGTSSPASGGASARGVDTTAPAGVRPSLAPASSIELIWPAAGQVVRSFNGSDSKGIDIVNTAGTPVLAAAPGTVVYAGNGLRGYGNLLIIKHNANFLTAYAHNRALLAKEGQNVTQGQQVAEMGDTDNNRVALHFELRYDGKSIDPKQYLPAP
jgi:lipoprotein YgeR